MMPNHPLSRGMNLQRKRKSQRLVRTLNIEMQTLHSDIYGILTPDFKEPDSELVEPTPIETLVNEEPIISALEELEVQENVTGKSEKDHSRHFRNEAEKNLESEPTATEAIPIQEPVTEESSPDTGKGSLAGESHIVTFLKTNAK